MTGCLRILFDDAIKQVPGPALAHRSARWCDRLWPQLHVVCPLSGRNRTTPDDRWSFPNPVSVWNRQMNSSGRITIIWCAVNDIRCSTAGPAEFLTLRDPFGTSPGHEIFLSTSFVPLEPTRTIQRLQLQASHRPRGRTRLQQQSRRSQ